MARPQAVFLDFDGVVLESLDVKAAAMAALFADRPAFVDEIVRYHLGNGGMSRYEKFRHYYAHLFREPLSDARMSELDVRFTELCDAGMRAAAFVPGALEFLRTWHDRIPIFVISGAPQRDVDAVVDHRGLRGFFRSVHGSPVKKAEHLARLLAEHRLDPEACVFVGDARADQEAAAAAGVPFVQRLTPHTPRPFEPRPTAALPDLRGLAGLWGEAPRLRVALARSTDRPPGPGRWTYLGRDPEAPARWRESLDPGWEELDVAQRLQDEAARLRRPYLDWVDALDRAHGKSPDWWSGQIAEKNPLAEPTFLHASCLSLLRALIRSGEAPDLVVVDTPGMARAAAALCASLGRACLPATGTRRAVALDWLKALVRWAGFAAEAARAAVRRPALRNLPRGRTVLIGTYLHASSLGADGRFRDRYFRRLPAVLESEGWEVCYLATQHAPLPPPDRVKAWLASSPDRFVQAEDWLKPTDHLSAAVAGLRLALKPLTPLPLDGLDVSALAEEACRRGARSRESQTARLTYRLVGRLAEGGFRPALVLSWFENLRAEKTLALAARERWPEADHAGYFSILPNPNYLPPTPLPAERDAGVLPGRLVCSGAHGRDILAVEPAAPRLSLGAALRYGHVWDAARGAAGAARTAVLTPLPSRLGESAEVLAAVMDAMPLCPGLSAWWVCPHPDYSPRDLDPLLPPRPWPEGFQVRTEGFDDLLPSCAAVATSGSGTAVEALCAGRPVAVIGRRTDLDFDPLAYFPGAAPVCRGGAALAAALSPWLADPAGAAALAARQGDAIRSRCFEPETPASLAAFSEAAR